MTSMIDESTQFVDESGAPIVDGYIYIGVALKDPERNPASIYADRNQTIQLANPQRTDSFGRSINKIWIEGRYSIKVEDNEKAEKLQELDRGEDADLSTVSLINVQGVNTVTAEAVQAVTKYEDKAIYVLTVVNENTGPVTLEFGEGAKPVTKNSDEPLVSGDWPAGSIQRVIWNKTSERFELLTQSTSELNAAVLDHGYKLIPLGMPFPIMTGFPLPSNAGDAKYILLTAGQDGVGGYNEGMLTGETITGTAPKITAVAVINVPGSFRDGETIHLINTSKPFIRPGESGVITDSQNLAHTHTLLTRTSPGEGGGVSGSGLATAVKTTSSSGGDEAKPYSIEWPHIVRVK